MIALRSVNVVRHPRGKLHSNTHCCLWSGHNRKQTNSLALPSMSKKVVTRCRSPSYERFLEEVQFTLFMRLAEPHGASRLVQTMSIWLVKTRRAPSRHSRDAREYGHTTTVMHKLSTPPALAEDMATAWAFLVPKIYCQPALPPPLGLYRCRYLC